MTNNTDQQNQTRPVAGPTHARPQQQLRIDLARACYSSVTHEQFISRNECLETAWRVRNKPDRARLGFLTGGSKFCGVTGTSGLAALVSSVTTESASYN